MHPLTTHLLNVLRTQLPPVSGTVLIVAVSGGVDSLALLHMLKRLASTLKLKLHVATLDHGLRGAQGAEDAAYVADLARRWGLNVTRGRVHAGAQHSGIEASARRARYNFLAQVAYMFGSTRVLTAHHAGDQAETVLMNLIRGTGISGLSGMRYSAPLPMHPDLTLIRPLLDVSRAELEAYCAKHRLQARTDATNTDTRYRRNAIRHEIMPRLSALNPRIEAALGRLASTAALQEEFMLESLWARLEGHLQRDEGRWTVDRAVFRELHPALRHHFLGMAAGALHTGHDDTPAGTVHIMQADETALHGQVGTVAQFPDGIRLRVGYEVLYIEHESTPFHVPDDLVLLPEDAEIMIHSDGVTRCTDSWGVVVSDTAPESGAYARFDIPQGANIRIRTRRAGDRFRPSGMGGNSKKINKWMIDHKIPLHWRTRIPLFIIDDRVEAIIFRGKWFTSESEKLDKEEKSTPKFTFIIPM